MVDCVWNVMAHAQKPDFVFWRKGRVNLNRRGRQFIRLLAGEVCASAVVMLDTPSSQVVWRVLATHSIRQFPLHFPSCASPCAITFQLDSNTFLSPKQVLSGLYRLFTCTCTVRSLQLLHCLACRRRRSSATTEQVQMLYKDTNECGVLTGPANSKCAAV